ncbi:hypothetical protein [Mycobacterium sp.]|uniref:hypothetical protein n=1 Tax=Mycobacterium sp. TaxID=1785 RepID=UPI002C0820E3|nr:hypothetical protein [Mycobacterium sp.]HTQ18600.1 hypothetical protein [Mycobacterium sp.]
MQRQEIRSLADLAGEGTRILTALVRDTHSGIAERVFGSIGPASKPVEVVHNTIAAATYYAVDHGCGLRCTAPVNWRPPHTAMTRTTLSSLVPRSAACSPHSTESMATSWSAAATDSR